MEDPVSEWWFHVDFWCFEGGISWMLVGWWLGDDANTKPFLVISGMVCGIDCSLYRIKGLG